MSTWEAWNSGFTLSDGINSRHQRIIWNDTAGDSGQAITAALALAPTSVIASGYTLDYLVPGAEPYDDGTLWRVVIDYQHKDSRPQKNQQVGDSRLTLDISGSEILITQAIEQANYGPDYGKAINVIDGKAHGANIIVPKASFTERHTVAAASMTQSYVNQLIDTVGTCNDDTYRGRAAEELLLLAIQGEQRGTGDWDLVVSFGLEKERTILDANDTPRTKPGWRYAWWSYHREADVIEKKVLPRPEGLHIAKVYETIDFAAQLGF